MKHYSTITMALMLACGMAFTGIAVANDDSDSDSDAPQALSRHGPDAESGSGHTVADECDGRFDGTDFAGQKAASGTIQTSYGDGNTVSQIKIKNARPNTHYTVWVRLFGKSHGSNFGSGNGVPPKGSPLTNGGATPYAPSSEVANLVNDWADSSTGCIPDEFPTAAGDTCGPGEGPRANGFVTNSKGKGGVTIYSDFTAQAGGAYPFNRITSATLTKAFNKTGHSTADPTAIADPRDPNMAGTPFLFRMVSHCQDNASHGVSPGDRETWFNFP